MEFDNALKCIGEFGLYQKKFYLLLHLAMMPLSSQLLVLVFVAAPPTWICLDLNSPATAVQQLQCSTNGSVCSKAVYTSESTTIGTEWHLVCADSYKNELAQSVFMLGTMIGAPLCGNAADKYGRKELWMVVITMSTFWGFLSSFSPNYYLFLIFRFLVGVFVGGGILVTFVLATEMIGPTKRGMAGTFSQMFGSIKLLILALLAYYIRDWRALILATVMPGIFVVFTFNMVPESPRWLLSEGRFKEAEEIMKDAALVNGVTLSKPIRLVTHLKGKAKHEMKDLFKHSTLCAITIALMFVWFSCSLVYYGISLNLKNLGGDIYTNFAISASVEFPANFCTIFFISWSGRRKSLFIFLLGTATSCWCCMKYTYSESAFTMAALAATGKFFITATFAVIYVFSAELFPTVIRNLGMGVVSFTNRMGGVLAPFVVLMGEYDRSLPMLVFAVLALIAAVISCSLPETNCKALPETVEDCEMMFSNKKTIKTGLMRT